MTAPEDKVDVVRRSFEAIGRRDIEGLLDLYHPEVQFLPLTGTRVETGGYIGHDGVRDYFAEVAEVWDELRPRGNEFHVYGDHVIVVGRCLVRGKGSGVEDDSAFSWVITVRDDKVTRHRAFRTTDEALEFATQG